MRTRLGVATAVACTTVLVGSALTATAAVPVAPPSTPTAPVALLLVDGGLGLTILRVDTGVLSPTKPVKGLRGQDTRLVGIDVRAQDGLTYAVGDAGGIYTLNDRGALRKVRQLTTALSGTAFGVDFNPVANALRIISDTGQNLRQTFADTITPTAVDGALNYTAGTTATGVAAAAYTNNDFSADSGTTLFDIDATLDQVVTQAPANNGSLQPTGKLGADVTVVGFDIFTLIDSGSGRATDNTAYAVVPGADGTTTLHTVSLLTGQAPVARTLTGSFVDIAVKTLPAPPA